VVVAHYRHPLADYLADLRAGWQAPDRHVAFCHSSDRPTQRAIGVPLPIAQRRRSPIPAGVLSKAMLVAHNQISAGPPLLHNGFNRFSSV
jgi:hypothetical protein